MISDEQIKNLPDGLLIRARDGKLKKVQAGRLVDLETTEIPEKEMPVTTSKPIQPEPSVTPMPPQPKQVVTPVAPAPKADFYFSEEDKEEIEIHRDKLKELAEKPATFDPGLIINKIIERNNLSFSDEILKKRFFNIINSRLTDIRESVETEEVLARSTKIGGMGLDEALVAKIMIDVENEAAKIQGQMTFPAGAGVIPSRPKVPVAPPAEIVSTLEMPAPIPPKIPYATPKPAVQAQEIKPKEPVKPTWTQPSPQPRIEPAFEEKPRPIQPGQAVKIRVDELEVPSSFQVGPKQAMPKVIRPQFDSGRPQIMDIKSLAKVIGPVDELREFTLKDFRRLGKGALESIEKIKEKISLLEEESFSLKTEGIKAWRSSEVNKLYLGMGQESIESDISIRDIISKKQAEGKSSLTEEEFSAIADLNRHLNY